MVRYSAHRLVHLQALSLLSTRNRHAWQDTRMSPPRILLCGDVLGRLNQLFKRVLSVSFFLAHWAYRNAYVSLGLFFFFLFCFVFSLIAPSSLVLGQQIGGPFRCATLRGTVLSGLSGPA